MATRRPSADCATFLDALPGPVAIFDRASRFLYGNDAFRRLDPEPPRDATPQLPSRKAMAQAASLAILGESPQWLEMGRGSEAGIAVWYHGFANPFRAHGGAVAGAIVACFDVSELKSGEAELNRRLGLLIDVQKVAHLGTWEWNLSSGTVSWSPELYRIYGVTPGEYRPTYEGYLRMIHPADRERVQGVMEKAFSDGGSFSHDERVVRPDGGIRYLHTWAYPTRDESGKVARYVGVCQDITERKLLEEKVRTEENLRKLIFDTVSDVLFCIEVEPDGQLVFRSVNNAFYKATGLSESQVLGKRVEEVIPEPSRQMALDRYRAALREGKPQEWDEITPYPSGVRYGEVTVTPLGTDRGPCTSLVGSVHDITERKRAAEKIAAQAALLDHASDAILVRDLAGKVLFWNEGATRLYGWPSKEAVGRNVTELLYTDATAFWKANTIAVKNGKWTGEILQRTQSGEVRSVEASWTVMRDSQGRPERILAINTDVTEKKKLQNLVVQAQRLDSLGTISRGVAHDFNNILTIIQGNVELAAERLPADDPSRARLEVARGACERAGLLVAQILAFGRQSTPKKRRTQVTQVVEEAVGLLRSSLPANIEISLRTQGEIPELLADPTQLNQIVMNLGTNAAHAMQGGGSLVIRTDAVTLEHSLAGATTEIQPGRYVRLSVEDTGAGIEDSDLQRIFDPYFTTKCDGSGLGLSVVHGIVKSHGGAIVVTTRRGQGTTFQVYLPVAEASREAEEPASDPPPRIVPGNRERILYVENEVSILAIVTQVLESYGYQVTPFNRPEDALRAFLEQPARFDAVVTDLGLPGMSGLDLAEAILRRRPDVPVLLTSGRTESSEEQRARRIGIRQILTKPSSIDATVHALSRIFHEPPLRRIS